MTVIDFPTPLNGERTNVLIDEALKAARLEKRVCFFVTELSLEFVMNKFQEREKDTDILNMILVCGDIQNGMTEIVETTEMFKPDVIVLDSQMLASDKEGLVALTRVANALSSSIITATQSTREQAIH